MQNIINANMIAPCGLDCSICKRALAETDPCPGCHGPDENKPEFCAKRCGIILCRKRKENGVPADLISKSLGLDIEVVNSLQ